jgi:two-component system, LytTR family, response regulator
MNTLTCIAIEDEPHALELLSHYAAQVPYLTWLGGFNQPLQALPFINQSKVQLLFLDINLPKLDGMSFYRSLAYKPQVIFTTAYSEYAVDGFSVEAVDYLVKPILLDRFIHACNKAFKMVSPQPVQIPNVTETVYVKSGTKWHQLNWSEILFLEKDENYVIFNTQDKHKVLTRQNLGDVEHSMPNYFCRVHKSFIINLNKINIIERDRITVGERKIPLADSYREAFMSKNNIH